MKRYFLICEYCDFGFWDNSSQQFRGVLYATKYEFDPSDAMYVAIEEFKKAVSVKPCKIEEVWYNE